MLGVGLGIGVRGRLLEYLPPQVLLLAGLDVAVQSCHGGGDRVDDIFRFV